MKKVVTAKDQVSTQLEILEILPCEQMADLLAQELQRRGFERKDDQLTRTKDSVMVQVDPESGTVTVSAEGSNDLNLHAERDGQTYDDAGPTSTQTRKVLQEQAQQDLQRQADREQTKLQSEITDRLAGQLADLRKELDDTVNKVTADALKQKAAQMGEIKEVTEDPHTGSLTIVLEV
jgi:hypothetical protein